MNASNDPHHPSALALARAGWERAAAEFLVDPGNPAKARAEQQARRRYDEQLTREWAQSEPEDRLIA